MDVRSAFFALLLVILGAITTLMIAPLLQYVMAAALLAFVLYPAHKRLEPSLGARPSALLLTTFAIVAAVVPILYLSIVILQTTLSFLNDVDGSGVVESIRTAALDAGLGEEALSAVEEQAITELENLLSNAAEVVLLEVVSLLTASIRMSIGLLVLVFVLYYLLVDGRAFVAWLADVAPLEDEVRDALFEEVDVVTWAVIRSHVLVALVQGGLGGLGFYLLGLPNAAFWTVIMVVVSFLPAVGIWLVWGPAVGYLASAGDHFAGVALLVYGVLVLSVVDNYLRAIFVDRGSGLHPAVVLVGVIGGIYLLGIMGLFLGPVILAVFKAGLNVFNQTELTSGEPHIGTAPVPVSGAAESASVSDEQRVPDGESAPSVD
ncbi:AI-2E family transporter [Halosolutus gelatinilyticus]|uniref:AI-2E family transporter n=1 Tax=Halosolutus gelatinilyticus TaxID=2931975 RepID=UPI001FF5B957|nr:AI-2E family transporter [Halosolutus gelatinilyticus]